MDQYGSIVTAKVTDENQEYYFAQYQGKTYAVNKQELAADERLEIGEAIEGMIYEDKDKQAILQVNLPDIRPGYYGWGQVVAVRTDLGVFVDVGLINKEVVVSLDDLPDSKDHWPRKGDRVYLTYTIDRKNRFWGQLASQEDLMAITKSAPPRLMNQDVVATITHLKIEGVQLITQEGFRAFIHESEWILAPRLGQEVAARVIKVQPDGSLNLSMKPRAHEAIEDDATMILRLLTKSPQGFLPLHDKSDPEAIKMQLGISKAQFKRAVGSLLKNRQIRQVKGEGVYLLNDAEDQA